MHVFICLWLLPETFLFLRRNERNIFIYIYMCVYIYICIYVCVCIRAHTLVCMCSTRYFCQMLLKHEFAWHIFEKVNKISWKSFQWEPSSSILTEGQTAMKSIILVCCCLSNETKNLRVRTTQRLQCIEIIFHLMYDRTVQVMVKMT